MAKDPAFLFYYQDFIVGTMFLTNEQIGCYIKILCNMADKGRIKKSDALFLCGGNKEILNALSDKLKTDENGLLYNKRIEEEVEKRKKYTESRRQSRLKADEDNVKLYLIKDNTTGYVKIGSSVNPKRRFSEMCNQKNPAITVGIRDYKLIFESMIVKRTEEDKMHKLFSEKRITGEWFDLNKEDIAKIRKTYEERTLLRTENENEDVNINKNNKIYDDFKFYNDKDFKETFIDYLDMRKKKKKPATDKAIKNILNKLHKYNIKIATEMLNNSINNSWTDVYPLKEEPVMTSKEEQKHYDNKIKDKEREQKLQLKKEKEEINNLDNQIQGLDKKELDVLYKKALEYISKNNIFKSPLAIKQQIRRIYCENK